MRAALTVSLVLAAAAPAFAQANVARVPAARALPTADWTPAARRACIDMGRIAGAIVLDDRTVEMVLRGGQRLRMSFARPCPALGFYGGFYYKRRDVGRLCAGRDQVIGREGGACRIGAITVLRRRR